MKEKNNNKLNDSEKLKEYFLEEERFNEFSDFFGYRVLGTFQFFPKYGTLISSGIRIFKTEPIAWVEEFKIGIVQNAGDYLVMVSPECPEVYFTMPEEIIDKIKDIYRRVIYIKAPEYRTLIRVKDLMEQYIEINSGFAKLRIQFDFNPMNL